VIVYTIAGIVAARIRGDGHFYGEPFGGYNVSSNAADLKSVLLWVGLLFLVLASLLRTRE